MSTSTEPRVVVVAVDGAWPSTLASVTATHSASPLDRLVVRVPPRALDGGRSLEDALRGIRALRGLRALCVVYDGHPADRRLGARETESLRTLLAGWTDGRPASVVLELPR